jgi:thymidylate kinase
MPLIYVTGISGSGKSEVRKELLKRGFEAHGTDEDGIAAFYNNETGEIENENANNPDFRTPEWRAKHTWKAQRDKVKGLADKAKDKPIFLCGVVANDNEIWDLFGKVFALVIDESTLKHRITNRTENNFGQNPHEFAMISEWQKTAEEDYRKFGATIIDATKPLEHVVDEIVSDIQNIA